MYMKADGGPYGEGKGEQGGNRPHSLVGVERVHSRARKDPIKKFGGGEEYVVKG